MKSVRHLVWPFIPHCVQISDLVLFPGPANLFFAPSFEVLELKESQKARHENGIWLFFPLRDAYMSEEKNISAKKAV